MNLAFPTLWQLLLPNLNLTTVLGILAILLGIYLLYAGKVVKLLGFNLSSYGWISIISGIVLIWGVSIIQDLLFSSGGSIILWGIVVLVIVGFVLFYEPKNKK